MVDGFVGPNNAECHPCVLITLVFCGLVGEEILAKWIGGRGDINKVDWYEGRY